MMGGNLVDWARPLVLLLISLILFDWRVNAAKGFQYLLWSLDEVLGGAPHRVTLPGPNGIPLFGSLLTVRVIMRPP